MAKESDAPPEHRGYLPQIPASVLQGLTPEELRHRLSHVHKMISGMPSTGDADHIAGIRAHASKLLRALPIRQYFDEQTAYRDTIASLPGGGIGSPASDARRAQDKHAEANRYPPGFEEACDARLRGHPADCDSVDIDGCLGIAPAAKAVRSEVGSPGDGSQDAHLAQLVRKSLDERVAQLRRDIEAERTSQR